MRFLQNLFGPSESLYLTDHTGFADHEVGDASADAPLAALLHISVLIAHAVVLQKLFAVLPSHQFYRAIVDGLGLGFAAEGDGVLAVQVIYDVELRQKSVNTFSISARPFISANNWPPI